MSPKEPEVAAHFRRLHPRPNKAVTHWIASSREPVLKYKDAVEAPVRRRQKQNKVWQPVRGPYQSENSLMGVPMEARLKIYEHFFENIVMIEIAITAQKSDARKHGAQSLLFVNRKIRVEAFPVFFNECTFKLPHYKLHRKHRGVRWWEHLQYIVKIHLVWANSRRIDAAATENGTGKPEWLVSGDTIHSKFDMPRSHTIIAQGYKGYRFKTCKGSAEFLLDLDECINEVKSVKLKGGYQRDSNGEIVKQSLKVSREITIDLRATRYTMLPHLAGIPTHADVLTNFNVTMQSWPKWIREFARRADASNIKLQFITYHVLEDTSNSENLLTATISWPDVKVLGYGSFSRAAWLCAKRNKIPWHLQDASRDGSCRFELFR